MKKEITLRVKRNLEPVRKYTMGKIPHLESEWESLANELLEWVQDTDSLCLRDFPISKGYSPGKFYKWVKHSEYFSDALDIARAKICSRREIGALKRKYDSTVVMRIMPVYDPEYKEYLQEQASLKSKDDLGKITVIMESIADAGVKPLQKDSHV